MGGLLKDSLVARGTVGVDGSFGQFGTFGDDDSLSYFDTFGSVGSFVLYDTLRYSDSL